MNFNWDTIASLYASEQYRLKRMLVRKGMSNHSAADAVQEGFVRLLLASGNDIRDPRGYLYRTVENAAFDIRRRERRAAVIVDPDASIDGATSDPHPVAEEQIIAREELASLDAAIVELSPRSREVLIMHKFEGLSYAEIADRLGISKNTVMVHMVNALGALRAKLGKKNPSDTNGFA